MIIDHLAIGIVCSLPFHTAKAKSRHWVGGIAALLPDMPVLFMGGPGTIEYLSHRTTTHCLLFWPLFAAIPAILIYLAMGRNERLRTLYIISLTSYLMHITFDLITPFGTQLLYPFSNTKFSLDILHSFDPVFIAISATFLFLFFVSRWCPSINVRMVAVAAIGCWTIWMGIAGWQKTAFGAQFCRNLPSDFSTGSITIVPRTYWRWKGIAASDHHWTVGVLDGASLRYRTYEKQVIKHPIETKALEQFLDYARFPVIEVQGDFLEAHNLIYSPLNYRLRIPHDTPNNAMVSGFDLSDPGY